MGVLWMPIVCTVVTVSYLVLLVVCPQQARAWVAEYAAVTASLAITNLVRGARHARRRR